MSIEQINYILPGSTKFADSELRRIHHIANDKIGSTSLTKQVLIRTKTNITYGCLGVYCNALFRGLIRKNSSLFHNNYIIDHSYSRPDFRGSIFRLSRMNTSLETIVFPYNMISGQEKDGIYQNLLQVCKNTDMNLMVPIHQALELKKRANGKKEVLLFIKNSSLHERIKNNSQSLLNHWITANNKNNNYFKAVSFKPWEMAINRKGNYKERVHIGKQVKINSKQILQVYCPSSMIAIDFILKGCPVRLSSGHPLYKILGNYIPQLSFEDRIDIVMNCIVRTSFSINYIQRLHKFLIESK